VSCSGVRQRAPWAAVAAHRLIVCVCVCALRGGRRLTRFGVRADWARQGESDWPKLAGVTHLLCCVRCPVQIVLPLPVMAEH
jgi:hypothetical protein